jgi:structural maintenance of chromosomes protein 6
VVVGWYRRLFITEEMPRTTKKRRVIDDDDDEPLEFAEDDESVQAEQENDTREYGVAAKENAHNGAVSHRGAAAAHTPQKRRAPNSSHDNGDDVNHEDDSSNDDEMDATQDDDEQVPFSQQQQHIATRIRPLTLPPKPAEAGVIQEVYVENFMCHTSLRIALCRNVNFIHGQNGSGKSAILAAIQICLGAGARRTHRAKNLKELVRKDEGVFHAKVQVTLLNHGGDGYKHEIYGDQITIERSISIKGGYNGYKLYDADMKEISRDKKDLNEMLDVLYVFVSCICYPCLFLFLCMLSILCSNIQVENPVAVLDQEESKKFLTGKAEDKYAFFMKATDLERIDRVYAEVMDEATELQQAQKKMFNGLKDLQANVQLCKQKWEEHQALEKLQRKLEGLNVKYAWAFYAARQDELDLAVEVRMLYEQ